MAIKPILFNTDMVRAILDGRKTVTRRVIKLKYSNTHIEWKNDKYGKRLIELQNDVEGETHGRNPNGSTWRKLLWYRELKAPYTKGDILYVRETWAAWSRTEGLAPGIHYKTDGENLPGVKWKPSIHMPKEAARIWLKVTDVRVERLHDMTYHDARKEGILVPKNEFGLGTRGEIGLFAELWDSTIKKNLLLYGWDASPWVWVIEFERTVKPNESSSDGAQDRE